VAVERLFWYSRGTRWPLQELTLVLCYTYTKVTARISANPQGLYVCGIKVNWGVVTITGGSIPTHGNSNPAIMQTELLQVLRKAAQEGRRWYLAVKFAGRLAAKLVPS